ncbi:MAG: sulfotransferase [Bacteroidales bacterium]|jgi:LPS sulfotransferase NodH|nr:sulfotransferase [Bacteroidales bacterium]
MHSYILTGIRIGPLMRLLRDNGFTPSPKNIGRLIFVFQNGLWSSILARREKKLHGRNISQWPVPDDPLIIVGHWRTGSTFLHQLLSCDDRFISPTLYQCSFPESFINGERFYRPVMGAMVRKRPIDNMDMGFDDAQEDEFAWVKLVPGSPFLKFVFPDGQGYFVNAADDFIPPPPVRRIWKEQMQQFGAKICRDTGKRLLLKNPFHSLRIPFIREVFPNAKFIHLHRHPYEVVASSLSLWKVVARDNQLKGKPVFPGTEAVAEGLKKFYSVIERDLAGLPENNYFEISYESLVKDPILELNRLYVRLGMDFSDAARQNMAARLQKVSNFRKNTYTFDDSQKELVYRVLSKEFEQYHYPV